MLSLALVLAAHAGLWRWLDRPAPPAAAPPADTAAAIAVDMTTPPAAPPPAPVPARIVPAITPIAPPVAVPAPLAPAADPLPAPLPPRKKTRHRDPPRPPDMPAPQPQTAAPAAPTTVAATAPRPGPTVPPAAPSATAAGWQDQLRARLRRFRAYPPAAEARGEEGTVSLRVVIGPQGEVDAVSLAQSSGYPTLDEAAFAWIRRSVPLPRPPGDAPLSAVIPLQFTLNDEP